MSWYTSRRHYFNRITNDTGNKLRFFTKPNVDGRGQPQLPEDKPKPSAKAKPKTKTSPAISGSGSSTTSRTKNPVPKAPTAKETQPSKRKVAFVDKGGKKTAGKEGTKGGKSTPEKRKKTIKVTPDNFI